MKSSLQLLSSGGGDSHQRFIQFFTRKDKLFEIWFESLLVTHECNFETRECSDFVRVVVLSEWNTDQNTSATNIEGTLLICRTICVSLRSP